MSRQSREHLWRTQNFLHDPELLERLVATTAITHRDVVYDLGAGSGALTAALARRAGRVIAIEWDDTLAAHLRSRFRDQPNVAVREADILSHALPRSEYVVVANPPFDITAELVRRLTSAQVPPREAYLVLQREAAQRFIGRPRTTLAAVLIAPWFSLKILHRFKRTDFNPTPSVDAVFVHLHKRGPPLVPESEAQLYRDLVAVGFAAWRASIGEALAYAVGSRAAARLITASRLAPKAKPSEIPLLAWIRLYEHLAIAPDIVRRRIAGSEARLRRQQRRITKKHRTRVPRDALHAGPPDGPAVADGHVPVRDRLALPNPLDPSHRPPVVSRPPQQSAAFRGRRRKRTTGPIGPSSLEEIGGQRGNRTPTARGG